jgi:hypothetical protein
MKSLLAAALAVAAALTAAPASADGSAPKVPDGAVQKSAPGVIVLPDRVIYGRPNRPMVQIDIRALSATSAAGAAHETLRASLVNQSQPATMR